MDFIIDTLEPYYINYQIIMSALMKVKKVVEQINKELDICNGLRR